MPKKSGQSVLTKEAYLMLARKMLQLEPSDGRGGLTWASITFAFAFMNFLWHTTARPEGIETLLLEGLSWKNDALICDEMGGKRDNDGTKAYGKHLYSNIFVPEVDIMLAVAFALFCFVLIKINKSVLIINKIKEILKDTNYELLLALGITLELIINILPQQLFATLNRFSCSHINTR
jgi:hypothetical protein